MSILLVTVLLAVSLIVLTYPFIVRRTGRNDVRDPAEELAQQLRRARERVYEEIRALQQEYFLQALTEEEYREQLQAARIEAAGLLRQQQQIQETIASIDARVEADMREASGEDPSSESRPADRPAP